MKFVLTGGAGHITAPAAATLLSQGHEVTVIGRSENNLAALVAKGAKAAVGSVTEVDFLTAAFSGADAVYLMIPPNFAPGDSWKAFQDTVSDAYISALKAAAVKKVVLLSSIGAHVGAGVGPVDGLAYLEQQLATVEGLDLHILRPSYFMYNLFNMIPLIKNAGIMGSNFGDTDEKLVLVHTSDIAAAVAEEFTKASAPGTTIRYIASDERHPKEIAALLGEAIGKPGIPWVTFTDEQTLGAMLQAGLSNTIAEGYTALGRALRTGIAQEDYWKNKPVHAAVKLEDFAKEFAAAFNA